MAESLADFFIAGGTLPQTAPSYVERDADQELFEALRGREYCYVLTSRQMGKSSLMVRTAARLRREGLRVALIDLTAIGQNLTPVQWYRGMLVLASQQLGLEEQVDAAWRALGELGPVQRFVETLRETLLGDGGPPTVIFVDEVDNLRSLPFAGDEFLAAIRECHNRRAMGREWQSLTFCLLGVATPSDLIDDPKRTPFNVGRRVELSDFAPAEAAALLAGFGGGTNGKAPLAIDGARLLGRVLWWTRGHPYLTQRLCGALVGEGGADPKDVDALCTRLFLDPGARERDDNLLFVRERLVRADLDCAAVLRLYLRVWEAERMGLLRGSVTAAPGDPLPQLLQLAGIVRVDRGRRLRVRNRVYERAFTRGWVFDHLPDAALRRLRRERRVRLWRNSALTAGAGLTVAWLCGSLLRAQGEMARRAAVSSQVEYVGAVREAQSLVAQDQGPAAVATLERTSRSVRGWEWRYLRRQADPARTALAAGQSVAPLMFRSESELLAGGDGELALWDLRQGLASRKVALERSALNVHIVEPAWNQGGEVVASGWTVAPPRSPGRVPAVSDSRWQINVRKNWTQAPIRRFSGTGFAIFGIAVRPDGKEIAIGGRPAKPGDAELRLLDVVSGTIRALPTVGSPPMSLDYSGDGGLLVLGCLDGRTHLCRRGQMTEGPRVNGGAGLVKIDGSVLLVGGGDRVHREGKGELQLWSLESKRLRWRRMLPARITAGCLSRECGVGAIGDARGQVQVIELGTGGTKARMALHHGGVTAIALSRTGRVGASAGSEGRIAVWDVDPADPGSQRVRPGVLRAALAADGDGVVASDRHGLTLAHGGATSLFETGQAVAAVAITEDGAAAAYADGRVIERVEAGKRTRSGPCSAPVLALAFVPGSHDLLAGLANGEIVRCGADGSITPSPWRIPGPAAMLVLSEDGRYVAAGGRLCPTSIWPIAGPGGSTTLPLAAQGPAVFSKDGRFLAAADSTHTVVVHPIEGGRDVRITGPAEPHEDLAFAPDSRTLAIATRRGVSLWCTATGEKLLDFPLRDGAFGVRFAADSLLALGGEGKTHRWAASPAH